MIEPLNPNNNPLRKRRTLTQSGMNVVLYKLIKSLGGKVVISHKELRNVTPDIAIRVDHDTQKDVFTLSVTRVNQSPIIIPNKINIGRLRNN